jgi:hypothetical protein
VYLDYGGVLGAAVLAGALPALVSAVSPIIFWNIAASRSRIVFLSPNIFSSLITVRHIGGFIDILYSILERITQRVEVRNKPVLSSALAHLVFLIPMIGFDAVAGLTLVRTAVDRETCILFPHERS